MRNRRSRWALSLCVAAALAAVACASTPPTHFYVLVAQADDGSAVFTSKFGVGVGPVTLPSYLDRPQIVTRSGRNQLRVADFDQWGEPLGQGVSRTLADNLSVLLQTDEVDIYPWELSRKVDYQVVVDVVRFERDGSGDVVLDARWRIFRAKNRRRALKSRRTTHRASVSGEGYDVTVAAMSDVIAALSRDVAEAIQGL